MTARSVLRKYEPLRAYLAGLDADRVTLTLTEIEQIIGEALPSSARTRAWWINTPGRIAARPWLTVGWLVVATDLRTAAATVTFARRPADSTG